MPQVTEIHITKAGAPPGQRWVTVRDPSHPSFGLPILVQDRRGGGSTMLAGGGAGTQHLRLAGKERKQLSPEQQRSQAEYQKAREHNRQVRGAVREQHRKSDFAIASRIGVALELTAEEEGRWHAAYEKTAQEVGETHEWAERQATRKLGEVRRDRERAFTHLRRQVADHADRILTAPDAEAEIAEIAEETEARGMPGAQARVVAEPAQAGMSVQELREFLEADPGVPADPLDVAEKEDAQAAEIMAAAAKTADRHPDDIPLVAPKETVYHQIESQEEAADIKQMLRARSEAARELRRELVQLPAVPDPGGAASLERFEVALEQVEQTVQQERQDLLDGLRRRVETSLASALCSSVDQEWDTAAWRGYNIHKAITRGATDAFLGMSNRLLGYSFIDRRVIEAIGIQGAAQVLGNRVIEELSRQDVRDIVDRLAKFHDEVCPDIGKEALDRAAALRRQNEMLDEQAQTPIYDAQGKVIRQGLIDRTRAERMKAQNMKAVLAHLGTASASLEATATLLHVLREGRVVKTIKMRFVPDDKEGADLKARASAKRIGLRTGQYTIRTHDDGSATLHTSEARLKHYTRAMVSEAEERADLERLAAELVNLEPDYVPPFFRGKLEDGTAFAMRDQQLRVTEFMQRRVRPDGGGAVAALGVGAGKTICGFSYAGYVIQKGLARRALYIAPDTSLQQQVLGEAEKFTTFTNRDIKGGERGTLRDITARYEGGEQMNVVSMANVGRDIRRLEELGHDPAVVFEALGFDAVIVDECHKLTNLSGGAKLGRAIRKLQPKFRMGMTGTPIRKSPVELLDVVKWTNPGEFPSRASLVRQYGDMGIGTNAWHDAVAEDLRRMIEPYVWAEGTQIAAQAHRSSASIRTSEAQQRALAGAASERERRRAEARRGTAAGAERQRAYKRADTWYAGERYRVLRNVGWQENALMGRVRQEIESRIADNPGEKFILFASGAQGNAALDTLQDMVLELGLGDTVRLASTRRTGSRLSKAAVGRSKARFMADEDVRFALASDANALGHNLQRGDTIIHLDLAETAADEYQRNGRALRVGREEDVDIVRIAYEDVAEELAHLRTLETTERRLAAVGMTPTG